MTLRVRTATGTQTVQRVWVRGVGGLKAVKTAKLRTGLGAGDLSVFFTGASSLAVSVTPSLAYFVSYASAIVSGQLTATPVGGTAPFTYAWSVLYFDEPFAPEFSSTVTAAPIITKNVVTVGTEKNAVVQVTVTDSLGQTASTSAAITFVYETLL